MGGLAGCQGDGLRTETPTGNSRTSTPPPTDTSTPDATSTEPGSTTEPATDTPTTPTAAERSLAEFSFEGALFDTHVHWSLGESKGHQSLQLDSLTDRLEAHDVGAAVLFSDLRRFTSGYDETIESLTQGDVAYLPFMTPMTIQQFSGPGLNSIYEESPGIFHGVGEIVYYGGPMEGQPFDADPMPGIFDFAARHDLPVMLHPTQRQLDGINQVLPQYPDTNFLFHGYQTVRQRRAGDTAERLLQAHDNLYWTYDVIEMTNGLFSEAAGKDDFIAQFDANRSRSLERATRRLPQLLEVAPDRIMWGTDVVAEWNLDPAVYRRGIELTWDVIDSLPGEHRDAYAYQNAVDLFGG